MLPIHELLNRIKWDSEFGDADFVVAYQDRYKNELTRVPLTKLFFDKQDHFDFELIDETGRTHTIPLHRIREVYRNGKLIWHRNRDHEQ